jgi:inorganic pyrophosphatase
MNNISDKIKSGARAFLVTEYTYLTIYVIFICVILVILYTIDPPSKDETDGVRYAACFLCGAFLSGAAGWYVQVGLYHQVTHAPLAVL